MAAIVRSDVQWIPVWIDGHMPFGGRPEFAALNALRVVRCLDEGRSEFQRWTANDHRPDLTGQYRQVTRLVVDARKIPEGIHMFRIEGWPVALIVSEEVRAEMERAGCLGAKFQEVIQ